MGGNQMKQLEDAVDEKKMARIEAIILSMTVEGTSESGLLESIQKAQNCQRRRCGHQRSQPSGEAVRAEQ
ncbi:MAG: hypothetical protein ACLTTO_08230 [Lachnospiraceae bacterium]